MSSFAAIPVFALFCTNCGIELDVSANFCQNCGMRVKKKLHKDVPVTKTMPIQPAKSRATVSNTSISHVSPSGGISDFEFLAMFKEIDFFEKNLRFDMQFLIQNRQIVQEKLLPALEKIKELAKNRGLKFTKTQIKLLNVYREFYVHMLEGSISMGYRKSLSQARLEQLAVLRDYMRKFLSQLDLEVLGKIEAAYEKEIVNLKKQIVELDHEAGFENLGVAYLFPREELAIPKNTITFSLYLQIPNCKIGPKISVKNQTGDPLGMLVFQKNVDGYRLYKGELSMFVSSKTFCRSLKLEYAVKTGFSPQWKNRKAELVLIPHVDPQKTGDVFIEASLGLDPGLARRKYLKYTGLFN